VSVNHQGTVSPVERYNSTDATWEPTTILQQFPHLKPLGQGFFEGGGHVRDLTPHLGRIIYFHVIKVNINKA
jgi:hypothetical protein